MLSLRSKILRKQYAVSRQKPDEPIRLFIDTLSQLWFVYVSIFGSLGALGVFELVFHNELTLREHLAFGGAACIISFGGYMFYSGIKKRMRLGRLIHDIYHANRDNLMKIKFSLDEKSRDSNSSNSGLHDRGINDRIDLFGQNFVDNVASFFRELVGKDGVGCAIRMLRHEDRHFVTLWRSTNLSHRASTTESIPSDIGIGHAIRVVERDSAIWIVNDIKSADATLWKSQKNDDLSDIKNVMVAPINGFEDETKKCMGLLFVTSKNKWFRGWYAEYLMAISDNLGSILPFIWEPKEFEN